MSDMAEKKGKLKVTVELEVNEELIIFKIPLEALGNPQGLLIGPETNANYMPEGCTAFRVIKIKQAARDAEKKTLKS